MVGTGRACENSKNSMTVLTLNVLSVVVLLVLSAVITPSGDPFSLMLVFIPLYLLYELSVRIVKPAPAG